MKAEAKQFSKKIVFLAVFFFFIAVFFFFFFTFYSITGERVLLTFKLLFQLGKCPAHHKYPFVYYFYVRSCNSQIVCVYSLLVKSS